MKSIAGKLFAGFLCMAALTVGLLWLLQAGIMRDNYLNERVRAVDGAIQQAALENDIGFSALEERLNIRLVLVGDSGTLRYVSQGLPMRGMLLRVLQNRDAPPADGSVKVLEAGAGGAQYALLGRPLPSGGSLFAVFSMTDVREASRILLQQLCMISAVLLAASAALALVLSRMFSRPVREITAAARQMAAGKPEASLPVRSGDEIGQLAVALNDLGVQLQKTEKLRRELIANVSHELRSPLAAIQGYAETVRDVTWPDERKRGEQLSIVAGEAERLGRVVADILDYSKLQSGLETCKPVAFPLCPAVGRVAARHEMAASGKSLAIRLACAETAICFDPDKFDRVMENLLDNAINHADRHSDVAVVAENNGGACRISVTNRGVTIAPEELPHIWDRYYRAGLAGEEPRIGTGLGLAIVKSILEQHGAPYGAASDGGETTFWFEAPLAHAGRPL